MQVLGYRKRTSENLALSQTSILWWPAPYISEFGTAAMPKSWGSAISILNGTFALICDGVYVDVVRPATEVQESSRRQEHLFPSRSRRIIRVAVSKSL